MSFNIYKDRGTVVVSDGCKEVKFAPCEILVLAEALVAYYKNNFDDGQQVTQIDPAVNTFGMA